MLERSQQLIRAAVTCETQETGWRRGSESLGQLLQQFYAPDACFASPWVCTGRGDGWAALKVVFGKQLPRLWCTVEVTHKAALVGSTGDDRHGSGYGYEDGYRGDELGVSIDVDVIQRRRWRRGWLLSVLKDGRWDHPLRLRLTLDADNLRIKKHERIGEAKIGGAARLAASLARGGASLAVSVLARLAFQGDVPGSEHPQRERGPPSGTSLLASKCESGEEYPQATDADGRWMDVPAPRAGGRGHGLPAGTHGRYVYDPFGGTGGQWVMRWPQTDVGWLTLDNLPPPALLASRPGRIDPYPVMVDPGEAMVERTAISHGQGGYKSLSGDDVLPIIVPRVPSNLKIKETLRVPVQSQAQEDQPEAPTWRMNEDYE